MNGKMNVQVMTDVMTLRMETRKIPQVAPTQVLVKIKHVGICGSDLHYFEHGRIGNNRIVKPPFVLGHEAAGEIVEIGRAPPFTLYDLATIQLRFHDQKENKGRKSNTFGRKRKSRR